MSENIGWIKAITDHQDSVGNIKSQYDIKNKKKEKKFLNLNLYGVKQIANFSYNDSSQ